MVGRSPHALSVSSVPARGFGAGAIAIHLQAKSATGTALPSGLYFARLKVDGVEAGARKLIVVP